VNYMNPIQKVLYPEKCPVTGLPFFMEIHHPELGYIPTYGGPYDSYTIPIKDENGNWYRKRFDHDEGYWYDDEWIEEEQA